MRIAYVAIIASILLLSSIVVVATGVIPGPDGTINACYKTHRNDQEREGNLRVVSDPSKCKDKETPISWNQGAFPIVCDVGEVVGFDSNGNAICQTIAVFPDSINTPDSTGTVGLYTSIAIGTDGFAIISYYDSARGDLKLVHCTSASCSSFDTPITLDSTGGTVGLYTSIASGTLGLPIISYYDKTNGDLSVIRRIGIVLVP